MIARAVASLAALGLFWVTLVSGAGAVQAAQ